ncbi:MAG: hypothetical protein GEV06_27620 [Luteitalea sp.]|nr:hypothetical protein [Luteitalea sp.]
MESWRKLSLVDASGQPFDPRIEEALRRLLPRLRRQFPALRDDVALTQVLEEAGRRVAKREEESGSIDKLDRYAWLTVVSVATSYVRRASSRLEQKTLRGEASHAALSKMHARTGTADEIERRITLREVVARLPLDERFVFGRKVAGFSSQEIARERGSSVVAVDTFFFRSKRKIRSMLGIDVRDAVHQDPARRSAVDVSKRESVNEREAENEDGESDSTT